MEYTSKVQIKNRMGLHTRPATQIVNMLKNVKCDVRFTLKNITIDPKSILSILMLAAKENHKITITTRGEDAEETMKNLIIAFENQFGE